MPLALLALEMVTVDPHERAVMAPSASKTCFVVMPFGRKPLNDGSGKDYDFDKVYRVMQRAIQRAGLEPCRADQQRGGIIHVDMFRALRDAPVVLADLSLHNPNVFYELGIRHALRPGGTVLMCRAGSDLPFDLCFSRVLVYRYDGEIFDFEEVDRLVEELCLALEEAQHGQPDSPLHALNGMR
jgi:hypothetical protein